MGVKQQKSEGWWLYSSASFHSRTCTRVVDLERKDWDFRVLEYL